MTCIDTWRDFIWTWPSCGSAQCRGVPSGRARIKTAWTTCAELMMFRGRSSRPACLEKYLPPWTVTRIHKRGLQHIAFQRNYLSQSRVLLLLPVALPTAGVVSSDSSGSGSLHPGDYPEVVIGPPRTTRRAHRRRRPVRVEEPAVVNVPVLTIQDPLAAADAVVLDCRPPLLPVSMDIGGVDLSAGRLPAVSAGMDVLLLPGREPLSNGGTCWD